MKLKILLLSFLVVATLKAQDPRFSQNFNAPLHLNPALTGVFEGKFRFAANFRDQWTSIIPNSPYRTIGAGLDMRFRVKGGDYFALGLSAMNDKAGDAHLQLNKAHFAASYLKQLSGNRYRTSDQYLIIGAQIGLGQNSLNYSNLWFTQQFNQGTSSVDPNLPNGENNVDDQTPLYPDFNAGLLWYALFGDNANLYLGASMHHINSPSITYLNNSSEVLYRRWIANIGGELPMGDELSLLPGVVVMGQGPSLETNLGANFRYSNHDWNELALRIGLWTRFANKLDQGFGTDALIVMAMLELDRWNIGFSYDLNISGLKKATNYRGATELSLIYIHPEYERYKTQCPKF